MSDARDDAMYAVQRLVRKANSDATLKPVDIVGFCYEVVDAVLAVLPPNGWEQVRRVVDAQAEDEGLWFIAETAAEAYLQQELRALHDAIERVQP